MRPSKSTLIAASTAKVEVAGHDIARFQVINSVSDCEYLADELMS